MNILELNANFYDAKSRLLAERARGHVIAWKKNIERLQRFSDPKYVDRLCSGWLRREEDKAFLIGSVIDDCQNFEHTSEQISDYELSGIVAICEEHFAKQLVTVAESVGGHPQNASEAIMILSREHQLDKAVDILNNLLQKLKAISNS